ncbi:MFS transporter [Actinomadura graeca]|uniref:MFS transporter n=1 Tax=Actinomadura graeca TaxID=2750812 RepID=A0ABX8QQL9_9ACTN|nr:MFS transporter [Actinomadura graeca]QXJ21088.1 MFS transporter [Actinomadura graeca]
MSRDTAATARIGFLHVLGQVALQGGFYGFVVSMPVVLSRSGVADATIGIVVGIAAVVQIPAAIVGGALVDRFGPIRLLAVGALSYAAGACLLMPPLNGSESLVPFVVARVAQGIGFGLIAPAYFAALIEVSAASRRGITLALAASAQTLSLTIMPPLSLLVLGSREHLTGVSLVVLALVLTGATLVIGRLRGMRASTVPAPGRAAARRFGIAMRRSWAPPLAIILLYLVHWGSITAYLPQRAEQAGTDAGVFFIADGLAVLASRIPSGWLADRLASRWLVLSGLIATAIALCLLTLWVTVPGLIIAGVLTGGGSGLVVTPLYVDLSHLSDEGDRGSAFALASAALAGALVIGSVGAAPVVAVAGFGGALMTTLVALGLAAVVAMAPTSENRRAHQIAHTVKH